MYSLLWWRDWNCRKGDLQINSTPTNIITIKLTYWRIFSDVLSGELCLSFWSRRSRLLFSGSSTDILFHFFLWWCWPCVECHPGELRWVYSRLHIRPSNRLLDKSGLVIAIVCSVLEVMLLWRHSAGLFVLLVFRLLPGVDLYINGLLNLLGWVLLVLLFI